MDIDMEIEDCEAAADSDYEEEEFLLYVDADPTSLGENQIREAKTFKIFGLTTEKHPLIQIDNMFYEGEFDYSMGTHLFFEKDEDTPVDELYCKCDNYYQFCDKTSKLLRMSRVLLKDDSSDSRISQEKDIKKQLKVERTYEQALSLFLNPGRQPPRKIPQELNCEHLLTANIKMSEETGDTESQDNVTVETESKTSDSFG